MLLAIWIISGILASGLLLGFLDVKLKIIMYDRVLCYAIGLMFGPAALLARILIALAGRTGFKFW